MCRIIVMSIGLMMSGMFWQVLQRRVNSKTIPQRNRCGPASSGWILRMSLRFTQLLNAAEPKPCAHGRAHRGGLSGRKP